MNWIDVLGWVGSAVLVVSLLQTRVLRLRWINLAGCLVLIVFNALVEVWPMVGLNVVLAVINVVYLWKMVRTRHDDRVYTVLPVDADDRYLAHVLTVHADDIARHTPGFARAPRAQDTAYLVLHGDETVGVVVLRDAGGGTAQIVLDWVTPAYRDFSPGEFVFRGSGVVSRLGYRRVVSPAGLPNPYYRHIGFEPEGERWVLGLRPEDATR
ncbi:MULTISPECIES: hypothetical protein [unclassified Ornithinimicrobium]|uniref:hypothetical protein n=1 Tax=unclassified Ornithinimicrobium TaxID=2615080 RepID=UPI0038546C98